MGSWCLLKIFFKLFFLCREGWCWVGLGVKIACYVGHSTGVYRLGKCRLLRKIAAYLPIACSTSCLGYGEDRSWVKELLEDGDDGGDWGTTTVSCSL